MVHALLQNNSQCTDVLSKLNDPTTELTRSVIGATPGAQAYEASHFLRSACSREPGQAGSEVQTMCGIQHAPALAERVVSLSALPFVISAPLMQAAREATITKCRVPTSGCRLVSGGAFGSQFCGSQ